MGAFDFTQLQVDASCSWLTSHGKPMGYKDYIPLPHYNVFNQIHLKISDLTIYSSQCLLDGEFEL